MLVRARFERVVIGRRRWLAITAALLLILAGCSGAGDAVSLPPIPGDPGISTIESDGRSATVIAPESAQGEGRGGLVVVLHGYGGSGASALEFFGLREPAERAGLVLVAPDGTPDETGIPHWVASDACCGVGVPEIDDAAYLSALIDGVVEAYGVDPGRVYIVGHSNGGFMAYRMACEHADQVAAVASLAGSMDGSPDCEPTRPVSVLQIHGTADNLIFYDGGLIIGVPYMSAEQTVDWWRETDGCTGEAATGEAYDADRKAPGAELTPMAWRGCTDGTEVALWPLVGGDHEPSLTAEFATALIDWLETQRR